MSWNEEKVNKLKELWGKGNTASQIAEIIGGISRNAVIGKAHRLNLSAKIKTRTATSNHKFESSLQDNNIKSKKGRRSKFKSLIIEKNFEPENPKQLEELNENSCKWPIGHPDEKLFYFCGRSSLKDFSYCRLHLLYAFQPKTKKEEDDEKKLEEEYKENVRSLYNSLMSKLKRYDEDEIEHNYKQFQECKEDLRNVEHDIKLNESKTSS